MALATFDLMTPDYTQLVQTIHTYLQAFPNLTDEKVTTQMIGHCMILVRMGYYKSGRGWLSVHTMHIRFSAEERRKLVCVYRPNFFFQVCKKGIETNIKNYL